MPSSLTRSTTTSAESAGTASITPPEIDELDRFLARTVSNVTVFSIVVAVIVGLLRGTAPTGGTFVDIVMSAAFIAAVVWAARRASFATLAWFGAIAFVFCGFQWWLLAAGAALALVLVLAGSQPESLGARVVPVMIGALGIQVLLRLPGLGFTGSASIIAALAVLPMLIEAWRQLAGEQRTRANRGVLIAAVVAIVGIVVAGLSVLSARSDAELGIDAARDGLDFARAAEQDEAIDRLAIAEGHFSDAEQTLSALWAKPARLVPIVAQHARAVEAAAEQGAALTQAAASAAGTADIDQVRVSGGRIDLDLLARVGSELETTLTTVNSAVVRIDEVSVPWLVAPLAERIDEVRIELADAQAEIDLAAHATRVVPDMLGANGEKSYLVIFTTPAESRELGGFIGNWALLSADDGKISLSRSGRIKDLNPRNTGQAPIDGVADPSSYPERYLAYRPQVFFQNLTGTPDFPTVARATAEIFPQMGGSAIDGVMSVDPYAIAALLELSGPIELDGLDEPLSSDNLVSFLLEGQYNAFDSLLDREAALGDVAERAFSSLLSSEIPGPERLGAVLGPVARQDRLLMTTFDDDANAFLERVFLRGSLPQPVPGQDYLSVVNDSAVPRKLDTYLQRTISYEVIVDPATGGATSRVIVDLANNAPPDLDAYVAGFEGDFYFDREEDDPQESLAVGDNLTRLSFYTSADVIGFSIDDAIGGFVTDSEYGLNRYHAFVTVPAGGSVRVQLDLQQTLAVDPEYRLTLASQPLVNTDNWTIATAVAGDESSVIVEQFQLVEDIAYSRSFSAP